MLSPKLFRLLALLLGGTLALAACGGQPSALAPIAVAPTAAPAAATIAPTPQPVVMPAPTPSSLAPTGAPGLARGALRQRPIIVMIDNHPDAYPQTGLDHAAVVFEALAEFGVTRFMAVYAPGITPDAPQIGPIRSTRLYFAQWALGFHALYVHAGGSPQGLSWSKTPTR